MKNRICIQYIKERFKNRLYNSKFYLKEPPRNPRGLAPRMNWQNNFKNHSTNSKYYKYENTKSIQI